MGIITGFRVAAAGAAAWVAAPLVDMGVRGTRDQQLRAEWQAEGARVQAERAARVEQAARVPAEVERIRRARARAAQVAAAAAYSSIPAPREGQPARRSPIVGG